MHVVAKFGAGSFGYSKNDESTSVVSSTMRQGGPVGAITAGLRSTWYRVMPCTGGHVTTMELHARATETHCGAGGHAGTRIVTDAESAPQTLVTRQRYGPASDSVTLGIDQLGV